MQHQDERLIFGQAKDDVFLTLFNLISLLPDIKALYTLLQLEFVLKFPQN